MIDELPNPIRIYVTDYVARRRRVVIAKAIARAATVFIGWALLMCLADRALNLRAAARLAALLAGVAAFVVLVLPQLRISFRRQFDWLSAAAEIDQLHPILGQRLITVASQYNEPTSHRGSPQILQHLAQGVAADVANDRGGRLVDGTPVWRAIIALTMLLALTVALCFVRPLGLPRLLSRFAQPLADVPPVTTVQLSVTPANIDVLEGHPVRILASTERLDTNSVPIVHLSDDGQSWSTTPATQLRPREFAYSIPAADHDLSYFVTAGDAITPIYTVHVLRPPAVVDFRIRYTYPAYTRLPPRTVSNTDGAIEAPVGTTAMVSIHGNQPLKAAAMLIGSTTLSLNPTAEPSIQQAQLSVRQSEPFTLRMTARNGVDGIGLSRGSIRAMPDHPPHVRLVPPRPKIAAVRSDDVMTLRYEAEDDYGVEVLMAHVRRVSAAAPGISGDVTIPISGDARRLQGEQRLDLAKIELGRLAVGDVIYVVVEARDHLGQSALSEPWHLLITNEPTDPAAPARLAALAAAGELAGHLHDELVAAESDQPERRSHRLADALQSASSARDALIKAVIGDSSQSMSNALSNLVDTVETCAAVVDGAMSGNAPESEIKVKLADTADAITHVHESIVALTNAERAAAVVAERRMLSELAANGRTPELAAVQHQIELTVEDSLRPMGVHVHAADLDQQLIQRSAAGSAFLQGQHRPDFLAASRAFAAGLGRQNDWPPPLGRRLAAGALVEAARADGDLIRANDLQLAANAARRLSALQSLPATTQPSGDPRTAFPAAFEAMEHDVLDADPTARATAQRARELMRRWAGEDESAATDEPLDAADRLNAAMAANAAAARRQYEQSQKLDDELRRARTQPAMPASISADPSAARDLQQVMTAAKQIDQLIAEQARVRAAAAPADAPAAQGQRSITQQIEQLQQHGLINREPLQQARAASEIAAAALAKRPPDLNEARTRQAEMSSLLGQAWDAAIHEAARARLSLTPSIANLFTPGEPLRSAVLSQSPAWGRPPEPVGSSQAPLPRDEPAGYESALKAYFEVLSGSSGAKP
ncbi:MAG TPA: hypothetical protein VLI90_20285 [Tepidisphaeraceae bacterium]|nr:hypothetical protein [Tepidisphaeraceae bacterium]